MRNANLSLNLSNLLVNIFDAMDGALARVLFAERLSKSLSELLEPYHMISSTQTTIKAFGSSFEGMLKLEAYTSIQKRQWR